MATNTLSAIAEIVAGLKIKAQHVLDFHTALKGDLVPRNTSGAPEDGAGELGTALYPWGTAHLNALILAGTSIDPALISSKANRVASAKTRTNSDQVDFIRANGAAASATIQATATPLVVSIKGAAVAFSADISLTGLSTAPATNNTCLVNDISMTGATADKYVGERGTTLTIDTAGSEITALVGQMVALKGATEILFGYLKSATEVTNCYRGFFFDSSGAPIVREALADNDTLTLMKLGWVFVDSDGSTTDVSYTTPVIAYAAPGSPATGDYWLDQPNQIWKRWNGSSWVDDGRTLVGMVVMDSTNCVGSRSLDPYVDYSDQNNTQLEVLSATELQTKNLRGEVAIYGSELDFDLGHLIWDITADLEAGFTETSSTYYYAYVDKSGQRILSPERPYDRPDLKGEYHPYHAWRCVGEAYNDASSDLGGAISYSLVTRGSAVFEDGLSANSQRITDVADPSGAQDAASKNYVDGRHNATYAVATAIQAVSSVYPTYTNITSLTPSLTAKQANPWVKITAMVTLTTAVPSRQQRYKTLWSGTGVTSGSTGESGTHLPSSLGSGDFQGLMYQHVVQITCSAGNLIDFQAQWSTASGDQVDLRGDANGCVSIFVEELGI